MIYNKIILHILSAILRGMVILINNLISDNSIKREYTNYAENVDIMTKLYLTQGDDNGKQD